MTNQYDHVTVIQTLNPDKKIPYYNLVLDDHNIENRVSDFISFLIIYIDFV